MNDDFVFLATTALEEFWDKNKKIVFLSEGCIRYSKRANWQNLNYEEFPHPWNKDVSIVYENRKYINEIIEKIFPYFADSLNKIHNADYSIRYWRTFAAAWFREFAYSIFNSYSLLKSFMEQHKNFETIVMDESSYVVASSFQSYHEGLVPSDSYNLQIFSQILSCMGYKFPSQKLCEAVQIEAGIESNYRSILTKIRQFIIYKIYIPFTEAIKNNNELVFHTLPVTRTRMLLLSLMMLNNSSSYIGNFEKYSHVPVNASNINMPLRKELRLSYDCNDEFETVFCELLFQNIPFEFLEGYDNIVDDCKIIYKKALSPKLIISGKSWFGDSYFKHWCALCREKYKTILLGVQHGGENGSYKMFAEEFFSPDGYVTWGSNISNLSEVMDNSHLKYNIKSAVKLFSQKKLKLNDSNKDILFIGSSAPRHKGSGLFTQYYRNFSGYLSSQFKFIDCLSRKCYEQVIMRVRNIDHGWDVIQRYKDNYSDLRLDLWEKNYYEALDNCRICVIDHLSTTYVEALYANKPTILFWGEYEYDMLSEAIPIYDKLHDVGILHYSPESAAACVESIYDNANEWWMEPERQAAVSAFVNKFAYVPKNPMRSLKRDLNEIIRHHC